MSEIGEVHWAINTIDHSTRSHYVSWRSKWDSFDERSLDFSSCSSKQIAIVLWTETIDGSGVGCIDPLNDVDILEGGPYLRDSHLSQVQGKVSGGASWPSLTRSSIKGRIIDPQRMPGSIDRQYGRRSRSNGPGSREDHSLISDSRGCQSHGKPVCSIVLLEWILMVYSEKRLKNVEQVSRKVRKWKDRLWLSKIVCIWHFLVASISDRQRYGTAIWPGNASTIAQGFERAILTMQF
jgi:hypothetical protein